MFKIKFVHIYLKNAQTATQLFCVYRDMSGFLRILLGIFKGFLEFLGFAGFLEFLVFRVFSVFTHDFPGFSSFSWNF